MRSIALPIKKMSIIRIVCCILAFLACSCNANAQLPFRFDNKLYKAVYINEAIKLMNDNPNYVLIDVRSPGEYADTDQYTHMNIGHLKGAINISIDSIAQHLQELRQYSGKNIFLVCSHSQRSRRVSKFLADSGFTHIYNINGGMSVVTESPANVFPAKSAFVVTKNKYINLVSSDALAVIQNPVTVTIDVRSSNEFAGKNASFSNNIGRIKNAANIPITNFKDGFAALQVAKDKPVLLYDRDGSNSADAAEYLVQAGYTTVYNLYEGLSALLTDNYLEAAQLKKIIVNPPPYTIISVRQCIDMLSKQNNIAVLDARPAEEFNGSSSKEYLNIGRVKNAVNITSAGGLDAATANIKKDAAIILYGSYSSNLDADICKLLIDKDYTHVYYLYQGIGRLAWASFNIESCQDGINILTNHDGLY